MYLFFNYFRPRHTSEVHRNKFDFKISILYQAERRDAFEVVDSIIRAIQAIAILVMYIIEVKH